MNSIYRYIYKFHLQINVDNYRFIYHWNLISEQNFTLIAVKPNFAHTAYNHCHHNLQIQCVKKIKSIQLTLAASRAILKSNPEK